MIFKNYYSKEGIPSQGCVWNVYGMKFNNYCFLWKGSPYRGVCGIYMEWYLTIIVLRKGSPYRGVCGMYMEWYLTIIVLRKGFSHRGVCGMYMEWYLTIICLRLSECCWIILRQSWGDYSPIFTSASVLLNGEHNFWQGTGTLVISNNSNNFFFVYLVSHPRIL